MSWILFCLRDNEQKFSLNVEYSLTNLHAMAALNLQLSLLFMPNLSINPESIYPNRQLLEHAIYLAEKKSCMHAGFRHMCIFVSIPLHRCLRRQFSAPDHRFSVTQACRHTTWHTIVCIRICKNHLLTHANSHAQILLLLKKPCSSRVLRLPY